MAQQVDDNNNQDSLLEMSPIDVEGIEEKQEPYGPPRGAALFVGIMLTVYIIYYMVMWFEIFVLRGA